jgi:hypothetical protein
MVVALGISIPLKFSKLYNFEILYHIALAADGEQDSVNWLLKNQKDSLEKDIEKELKVFESWFVTGKKQEDYLRKYDLIIFVGCEQAPRGHTENSPIVDIAKVLSGEGKEIYLTMDKDSNIANEFLSKTVGKIFKWGDEL